MELIFASAFSLILIYCAYFDWTRRQVPDLLNAMLWAALFIPFVFFNLAYTWDAFMIAGVVFGILYIMNSFIVAIGKKFFISWADVVGIPPYVAAMNIIGANALYTVIPLVASQLISQESPDKKSPLFPCLAAMFVLYILISVAM